MFEHQGAERSDRLNRVLAAYLACIAGFVNSAGFVLIGSFTSHVTGNVGRLANDLAARQLDAGLAAALMVAAFFVGSFLASMTIESHVFRRVPTAYGVALSSETVLLLAFTALSWWTATASEARFKDMEAAILCVAMGVQNSLVTRLSGAVVRTTHLTGVITDLGIESARWFRWWRASLSRSLPVKLAFGQGPPERPLERNMALLATIVVAFVAGAILGALGGVAMGPMAMLAPAAFVAIAAGYAFHSSGRAPVRT